MCKGGITREETGLILNEKGLQAVKGFLQRILRKDDTPTASAPPRPGPSPDLWEPPIDNEV